jgi:outer membrane protein assembly factor BamB
LIILVFYSFYFELPGSQLNKKSGKMKKISILLSLFALIASLSSMNAQTDASRQWPSYRGPFASGVLDNADLPDSFDPVTMANIRWKTEVPGLGLSSPVIWGNRLFITTAISKSDNKGLKPGLYGDVTPVNDSSVHDWKVLCYDKNNGNIVWEKTSHTGVPAIKRHPKSTHANTSVATDGSYVVAFFGSEGLYCYDMKGNLIWEKNFGILRSSFFIMPGAEWEFASSPVLYNGIVVIQCDVIENSFIAAFDVKTGKELWKTKRDDYPTWSTPNIYMNGNKPCVAVNGYKHMGGYDLATGSEIWKMSGGGDIPIPTPITGKDRIYLNGAHGKSSPVLCISAAAVGDITLQGKDTTNNYVKWSRPRGGSYMHTLLLYRNRLYNMGWNGVISCLNPDKGTEIYNGKLGKTKSFVASPVASDGKIYVVDEEGTVFILKDGNEFTVLAEIPLKDNCLTAPAITDGMIYFRTQKWLFAVGKK